MGAGLTAVLTGLARQGALVSTDFKRISLPRGLAYGVAGVALLLGAIFAPLPAESANAVDGSRTFQLLVMLGLACLVRARQYFQVSADSLLAADRRAPILFVLPDDEWQARILRWMTDANHIVMYLGTTQWVNWELRQVIDSGRVTRLEHLRAAFRHTPWNEELMATRESDFGRVRAMLFRLDGSMVMITSRSRSRDSCHLAVLIAHQQLLDAATTDAAA